MYGKVMSIPDSALDRWVDLLAPAEGGIPGSMGPRDRKAALARHLVSRFHGEAGAAAAEGHFDRLFRQHLAPEDLPELEVGDGEGGTDVLGLLVGAHLASSRSQAKRLVAQGGVSIESTLCEDPAARLAPGSYLVQVGKRRFARVRLLPAGGGGVP
jgi:tyrosyl-tRNA synthetase